MENQEMDYTNYCVSNNDLDELVTYITVKKPVVPNHKENEIIDRKPDVEKCNIACKEFEVAFKPNCSQKDNIWDKQNLQEINATPISNGDENSSRLKTEDLFDNLIFINTKESHKNNLTDTDFNLLAEQNDMTINEKHTFEQEQTMHNNDFVRTENKPITEDNSFKKINRILQKVNIFEKYGQLITMGDDMKQKTTHVKSKSEMETQLRPINPNNDELIFNAFNKQTMNIVHETIFDKKNEVEDQNLREEVAKLTTENDFDMVPQLDSHSSSINLEVESDPSVDDIELLVEGTVFVESITNLENATEEYEMTTADSFRHVDSFIEENKNSITERPASFYKNRSETKVIPLTDPTKNSVFSTDINEQSEHKTEIELEELVQFYEPVSRYNDNNQLSRRSRIERLQNKSDSHKNTTAMEIVKDIYEPSCKRPKRLRKQKEQLSRYDVLQTDEQMISLVNATETGQKKSETCLHYNSILNEDIQIDSTTVEATDGGLRGNDIEKIMTQDAKLSQRAVVKMSKLSKKDLDKYIKSNTKFKQSKKNRKRFLLTEKRLHIINTNRKNNVNNSETTAEPSRSPELLDGAIENNNRTKRKQCLMVIPVEKEKPRQHICHVCGKAFDKTTNLNAHVNRNHRNTQFTCEVCGKVFKRSECLRSHQSTHSNDRDTYECSTCGKTFTQKTSLFIHNGIHTPDKPFICRSCGQGFQSIVSLWNHRKSHIDPQFVQICNRCGMEFKEVETLNEHFKTHNNEMPYACIQCDKGFKLEKDLNDHAKIHTKERKYVCKICRKKFFSRSHLRNHERIHTGEKRFCCDICGMRFGRKDSLKNHLHLHNREKKAFPCELCDKSFSCRAKLIEHTRVHTNEKPFRCVNCNTGFIQKANLARHIFDKSCEKWKAKPYTCKICGNGYSDERGLRIHSIIHTDEKPFVCSCNAAFNTKYLYYTHTKKYPEHYTPKRTKK